MNLAKRHLFLLFDFATLSPHEIRLNSSTFTWSTHIFEVVQESKQMIDAKMRQFQESLRLRRERLIEDLQSFAQQVNDPASGVTRREEAGFEKRTAAILEFYFRCRFSPMFSNRRVILHLPAEFRSNRSIGGRVTTLSIFRMAAESHIGFDLGNIRSPTKYFRWSQLGPQIMVLIVFIVLEILRFSCCRFDLKLPIYTHFWGIGGILPQIWSFIVLTHKRTILVRKHVV